MSYRPHSRTPSQSSARGGRTASQSYICQAGQGQSADHEFERSDDDREGMNVVDRFEQEAREILDGYTDRRPDDDDLLSDFLGSDDDDDFYSMGLDISGHNEGNDYD